ncbi:MAG: VCBS repeat-containing protein [Acidobacteria bacterium]|nr:VCBS repeat-containing protein [Acidobacteriota bacterium]
MYSPNEVSILLGNGSGGFWAATNFWLGFGVFRPHSIALGDFNGDGKQDLVTANSSVGSGLKNVSVLLSNCAPTPTQNAPFDFDGDGKTDLSIFRPSVGQWWLNPFDRRSDHAQLQ